MQHTGHVACCSSVIINQPYKLGIICEETKTWLLTPFCKSMSLLLKKAVGSEDFKIYTKADIRFKIKE